VSRTIKQLQEARQRGDLRAFLREIPYAIFLGLDLEMRDEGPLGLLRASPETIGNPLLPALHGGAICALLETTAILQIAWEIELISLPKTITLTISYLRSGRPQDVFAEARITRQGRRVTSVHVEAWQDDRTRPIAVATGHFMIHGA